jgi:probable rRNA maturation factor
MDQPPAPGSEVSVRIVDEDEMRNLNRRYRGKDRSTNVLAFPAALDELPGLPAGDASLLGDLVICAPVVVREAEQQGKAAADHWAHLLVHGFLHLVGFDHQSEDEAAAMEALEIRILADQGLGNPYEDRYRS